MYFSGGEHAVNGQNKDRGSPGRSSETALLQGLRGDRRIARLQEPHLLREIQAAFLTHGLLVIHHMVVQMVSEHQLLVEHVPYEVLPLLSLLEVRGQEGFC